MKLSHDKEKNSTKASFSQINTNVRYSNNTTGDPSSILNNNNRSAGMHKPEQQASMKSSKPIAPLPSDCIEQLYKETGPPEGSVEYCVLEKSIRYSYGTLLDECM